MRAHLAIAVLLVGCGGPERTVQAPVPDDHAAPPPPVARPSAAPVWAPPAESAAPREVASSPPSQPPPEPVRPVDEPAPPPEVGVPPVPVSSKIIPAKPVRPVSPSADDPLHGAFSLADATRGLTGKGPLVATIETPAGALTCRLLEGQAPRNVANFVGLARGLRPFRDATTKTWVKRPAYDGTTFHRIVRGFMIQGGDPSGTGTGEPGYVVPDEIWANGAHDRAGLLCTANRGPDTNGIQFFVTDGPAAHLDGGFTIFGVCEPTSVVRQLGMTPVDGEKPRAPVVIKSVRIRREK
jgi:peptidyl-prolyl cis-trans isomerase A (cyclophilin A)